MGILASILVVLTFSNMELEQCKLKTNQIKEIAAERTFIKYFFNKGQCIITQARVMGGAK